MFDLNEFTLWIMGAYLALLVVLTVRIWRSKGSTVRLSIVRTDRIPPKTKPRNIYIV